MKHHVLAAALSLAAISYCSISSADDRLVRFEGGIGETPVSNITTLNSVRGVLPGGQPWVIARLTADVRTDGRVRIDGRGLLLAGGNGIGTTGGQSVHGVLFCGAGVFTTPEVPLEPNGDFRIEGTLNATPGATCDNPALLIVNTGNRWFAAGIPQQ